MNTKRDFLTSSPNTGNNKIGSHSIGNNVTANRSDETQNMIWGLKMEVQKLQEDLARTRRKLEQSEVLLRNSSQRTNGLQAEIGVGRR